MKRTGVKLDKPKLISQLYCLIIALEILFVLFIDIKIKEGKTSVNVAAK